MQPLTEPEIRAAFVNCSQGEANRVNVPRGLKAYAWATGGAPSTYRISQGARVGRAGIVEITADPDGTVGIGGAVTVCIRGLVTF